MTANHIAHTFGPTRPAKILTGLAVSLAVFLVLAGSARAESPIDLQGPVIESLPEISGVYWNFDEKDAAGNTVFDASGNGIDAVLVPGKGVLPELVPGVNRPGLKGFGKALKFSPAGGGDDSKGNPHVYANLAVDNLLIFSETDFTGGLWLRLDAVSSNEEQTLILIDRGGLGTKSGPQEGHFTFFATKSSAGGWRMHFETGDGEVCSQADSGISRSWDLQDGEWHHLGFNFVTEGADGGMVTFWLDGEMVGEGPVRVAISRGGTDSATRRLSVGERSVTKYQSQWDGAVDDVFLTEGVYEFEPLP